MSKSTNFQTIDEMIKDISEGAINALDRDIVEIDDDNILIGKMRFIMKNISANRINKLKVFNQGALYGDLIERSAHMIYNNDKNDLINIYKEILQILLNRDDLLEGGIQLAGDDRVKNLVKLPFDMLQQILDKKLLSNNSIKEICNNLFSVGDISIDIILYFHEYIKDNFPENVFIGYVSIPEVNALFDIPENQIQEYLQNICSNYSIKAYLKRNLIGRNITNERMILISEILIDL